LTKRLRKNHYIVFYGDGASIMLKIIVTEGMAGWAPCVNTDEKYTLGAKQAYNPLEPTAAPGFAFRHSYSLLG
jgi:hypothetical protein